MKPCISFETKEMKAAKLGGESTAPDLAGGLILQNNLEFHLGEEDEIFEGYGRRGNSYPYRQFNCYTRGIEKKKIETAVLENDFLRAVFLPEYGGRLWSLWDKERGKNLLYTNDVLRFSNLAVRNAWFSGGVEWNMGVIGHSPYTTSPLFTAVLENEEGAPVLRMYEYERIRQATWQMDFWLGENDRFLNARMRIVNFSTEVIPMYWWSNMAVPEHENGRIIVPAGKAFTFKEGGVYKVDIPVVEGVDITDYGKIPVSVDYFFELEKKAPKYIAHVDKTGYGLLHLSTDRLQSRKLFSWGHKRAAAHWQEFLTEDAGNYVEIQAGLGKTQYGCLPMPPHTAWEWLERYGAIQLKDEEKNGAFEELEKTVTERVSHFPVFQEMEQVLSASKKTALEKARLLKEGSPYGALKNAVREWEDREGISSHLDFGSCRREQKLWVDFLESGSLWEPEVSQPPEAFMDDQVFFEKLKIAAETVNRDNWYAHYHLGLFYFQKGEYQAAAVEFYHSLSLKENPWAYHGIASGFLVLQKKKKAADAMKHGLLMRKGDLSYQKEGFRILLLCEGYEEMREVYEALGEEYQKESRMKFYYSKALHETGESRKAWELLCADGGLVVDDIREGEFSLGELWQELHKELFGKEGEIPYQFDFTAI